MAPTASTVLLQGETGVGKELVAHAIHNLSPRRARPLVIATLEKTYWRLEGEAGAATRLGINPSTLRSRMRKHGIRRPAPSEA